MRTDLWLKLFGRTQALAARRRMRRPRARIAIERFENRTMLAGVVSMEINGDGDLVITGDDSGNEFVVTQSGDTFTIDDPEEFGFDTGGVTLFDVGGGPVSGPVSVTGLYWRVCKRTSSTSLSRPTREVMCRGRLCPRTAQPRG